MDKKIMGSSLWVFGLVMLVMSANCVHAMTCSDAITTLLPCEQFVVGDDPPPLTPSASCCSGLHMVKETATTTNERRALCECLVNAAASHNVRLDKTKLLLKKCGIMLSVPIDPKIKCSSIP